VKKAADVPPFFFAVLLRAVLGLDPLAPGQGTPQAPRQGGCGPRLAINEQLPLADGGTNLNGTTGRPQE